MSSNNAGNGSELPDIGGEGQSEISDAEVFENSPQVSDAIQSLATFTASHSPLDLKALPNVEREGLIGGLPSIPEVSEAHFWRPISR